MARGLHRTESTAAGRGRLRRITSVLVVACVVGAAVGLSATPQAVAAGRTLQSVTVSLGSDGTISGLASTSLTQAPGGKTTTHTIQLSPTKWGNSLPIRVQTGYRYGGRSGTDLRDLVGRSGRIELTVTVTNTAVRPTTVRYDANGASHQAYALIGAPLTVLADADLGGNNLSQVVTTSSTDAQDVTNGVVGTGTDGHANVQWSAMLAPPRLAPSSTFTLVEDAKKFTIPRISISAQPGLITDASLDGLLNSAFSSSPSSALSIQKATISTITGVDNALAAVLGALRSIRGSLSGSAENLGTRTIANLQASTDDLQQSLGTIRSQLQNSSVQLAGSSSSSPGGALGAANSAVAKTLTDELGRITTKVLGSAPVAAPTTIGVRGCSVPSLAGVAGSSPTAYQLVAMVQGWLGTLSASSTSCRASVAAAIATAIGNASAGCPPGVVTLECDMATARSTIGAQEAGLTTSFRNTLTAIYRPDYLTDLTRDVGSTTQALAGLHAQANKVRVDFADLGHGAAGIDTSLSSISADLHALDTAVGAVQSDLGTIDLSGVSSTLNSLNVIAAGERATLGQLPNLVDLLTGIVTASCGAPHSPPTSIAELIGDLTSSCTGPGQQALAATLTGVNAYAQAVTASQQDWSLVLAATDPSDDASAAAQVQGTVATIATLSKDVGTVQTALGATDAAVTAAAAGNTADKATLDSTLQQIGDDLLGTTANGGSNLGLLDSISALYDPSIAAPTGCAAPGASLPAGNGLAVDNAALQCNADALVGHVNDAFQSLTDALDTSQTGLTSAITQAGALSTSTQSGVSTLLGGLASDATRRSAAAGRSGAAGISQVSGELTGETSKGKAQAQSQFRSAASQVTGAFTQATGKLTTANASLASDFNSLLTDLNGGPGANHAGGVVGVLTSNADTTGGQADQLSAQAAATSAFNAIQGIGLDAITQQQAEMSAALDQAQIAKPFAVQTPANLTVYAFTLGGK